MQSTLKSRYGGEVFLLYKGREAIELALKNLKLPKKSCVAINGFTCFAVYEAIKNAGFNVEYLDIEKNDLNFSSETLQKSIKKNPNVKVVIVQNTLGYPCQIEEIARICKDNKVILIEDLAHSVGTKYSDGKEAGTVGDIVVLSFSQDKMIDGISGGALITRNPEVASLGGPAKPDRGNLSYQIELRDRFYPTLTYIIRNFYPFGLGKIMHEFFKNLDLLSNPMGGLSTIHNLPAWYCNLIKLQFEKLEENLTHRKKIATIYAEGINQNISSTQIKKLIPFSSNLRFPIFVKNKDSLVSFLKNHGVYISDIWYDSPIAPKKYLSQTDYSGQCPTAEVTSSEILNLPTHINVSEKDAKKISQLINQWLKLT